VRVKYREKNSFAEVSKNLARYRSENIFVIVHKNNYVEAQALMTMLQKATSFSILHNHFGLKQNSFQICISAKPFFP